VGNTNWGNIIGGLELSIDWVTVDPGRVTIGSQNRSILFGGIGPKHMAEIKYKFEISRNPVPIDQALSIIESKLAQPASESEWQLAYDQDAIDGFDHFERLSDRFKGSYWGKPLDGRAMYEEDWTFRIAKKWEKGNPITRIVSRDSDITSHVRLKKFQENIDLESNPPRLPLQRDTKRILREEFLITTFFGIIPSFIWAYFNASPGYIENGWPGLVFGGIIVGLVTAIFWRPKTQSYRLGRNCGRVKPN
tara:strand:+ start:77 stop:823 length:747 start_codon:yes stop_codon:yes gene_type:complete